MKTAFIYSDDFAKYEYGPGHPLKPFRLKLTHDLIRAYGLFSLPDVCVVEARPAEEDDLLLYHTRDYIDVLNKLVYNLYGLTPEEIEIVEGKG